MILQPRAGLLAILLALFSPSAAAATSVVEDHHALEGAALAPFEARYEVMVANRRLGEATLELKRLPRERWQVDLAMRSSGLLRVVGLNARQSTVFDIADGRLRPLAQNTSRSTLFTRRGSTGTYDWPALEARWQGDLKPSRRVPVALQVGDLSGLLINLAAVADARPGATLEYRFVDDGRARAHRYVVAPELERVSVEELDFMAMRVTRQPASGSPVKAGAGTEETVIWVVDGVPTPVRMLQRNNGQDTYDLRLVGYTGDL